MIPKRLVEAAKAAQRRSDFPALERAARELVARTTKTRDARGLGNAYAYLGAACVGQNDADGARVAFERSRELLEAVGDAMGVVRALNGLAVTAMDIELDVASARRHLEEVLPIARNSAGRERHWLGIVLGNFGEVQRFESDYRGAIASAREALAVVVEFGDAGRAAWQLVNIAHCQFLLQDRRGAARSLEAAWRYLSSDVPDPRMVSWYFDVWLIIAAGEAEWQSGARLLGFVDAFRAERNLVRLPLLLPWLAPIILKLGRELPDDARAALMREGATLTLDQANVLTIAIGIKLASNL